MSDAIAGFGVILKIGDGATPTENFTAIAELTNVEPPELMLMIADVTNHSSSGATKEKLGTLKELGDLPFSINFLPQGPTHSYSTGLIRDWHNRTKRNFQFVFPDATTTTWSGPAYVTKFKGKPELEGKLGADIVLTPAGAWTLE